MRVGGRVESFEGPRGFGFLRRDGNGRRYFFHLDECDDLEESLPTVGEYLEFDSARDWTGRRYVAGAIRRPHPVRS